jgi:hypothetical protein
LDGGLTSYVADDWAGSLSVGARRNLAPFNVGGKQRTADKNIGTTQSLAALVRYGLYGRVSIDASVSHYDQEYTRNRSAYPQQTTNTVGLKLRYSSSDLVNFSVGVRNTPGKTSYDDSSGLAHTEDKTRSRNIDFATQWQTTGQSSLNGQLSFSKQQHAATNSLDPNTTTHSTYKNVTGFVNWVYTPRGAVNYSLFLQRDTGNNQSSATGSTDTFTNGTITTLLGGNVNWRLSGKVKLNAGGQYQHNHTDNLTTSINGKPETSHFITQTVGATYEALRWLNFNCNVQRLKHSGDSYSDAYRATIYGCTVNVILNGQE